MTMPSSPINVKISSRLTEKANPSIAFFDNLININNIGIMIGKLINAINELVLSALEAIPDTKVKVPANPKAPSDTDNMYIPKS